jgi:predicted PurR-regulated permease PerM
VSVPALSPPVARPLPVVAADPARVTLVVVFIAGMLLTSFWILRPFLPATIWATTIVVATWPLMRRIERRLWGRRGLAVAAMTALLLLTLIVPLALALLTIAAHVEHIVAWIQAAASWTAPAPPEWLERLPLAGARISARWREVAALSRDDVVARVSPYTAQIVGWTLGTVGGASMVFLQLLLVVLAAAVLYAWGENAADSVGRLARRVAGPPGDKYVALAGQAIRGVALGIVVTALVQTGLAAIGLVVSGAPFAAVLTALVFVLCIAQIGALLPLALAVGWLYWSGDHVWATALLIWSLVVCGIDNVLRPILIKRGADLPLLLVLLGVIGGLLTFGIVGIFLGPVVLAVGYTLLADWLSTGESETPPTDGVVSTRVKPA